MSKIKSFFIFFYLYLIISISNAFSDVVDKIEVKGNERISSETIVIFGDISLGKDYQSRE